MGCVSTPASSDARTPLQIKHNVGLDKHTVSGDSSALALKYAATTMRGWRTTNEDRFLVKFDSLPSDGGGNAEIGLFAVFDGHGGAEISVYAQQYFYKALRNNRNFVSRNYVQALTEIFADFDREMANDSAKVRFSELRRETVPASKAKRHNVRLESIGSTATVVLITEESIHVANIGDSKAVVWGERGLVLETVDHRPSERRELERIESLGGKVQQGRIRGDLNISRALGDYAYKNAANPNSSSVSTAPDVHTIERSQARCVVVGSDGIWENPDTKAICGEIMHSIAFQEGSLSLGVECFLNSLVARDRQSLLGKDNMTCIVVRLGQKQD